MKQDTKPTSQREARELGAKFYAATKPCKRGHIGLRYASNMVCVECATSDAAKRREAVKADPDLAKAEKEKINKWLAAYRARPAVRERINAPRRVKNMTPEQLAAKRKASRKTDERRAADAAKREARNQRKRERLKTPCPITGITPAQRMYEKQLADEFQRSKAALRNVVIQSFRRQGFTKLSRTGEILGCDWLEARAQIERQFLPGMTWENHGEKWELDHIVPLATASDVHALKKLCHIGNLRPVWAKENRSKGAKQTHLI